MQLTLLRKYTQVVLLFVILVTIHTLFAPMRTYALGTVLAPQYNNLSPVHSWAALNQVPNTKLSDSEIASVSRNHNLVVVKSTNAQVVRVLKSNNPVVTVLVYHNGAFAQKNEGTKYPESWYARDAYGNKVVQPKFGNYLMDIRNVDWINETVSQCKQYRILTGADGCYTDMMMTAPLFANYVSAKPIDPLTGKAWKFADYQDQVEAITDTIRMSLLGAPHAANGVARGKRWYATAGASSKTLTDHTNAAHSEIWLRDDTMKTTDWTPYDLWKQDVDMIVEAEAESRVVIVETKLWRKSTEPTPTPELVERWHDFALGSFLLGTQGKYTWFLFDEGKTFATMMQPEVGSSLAIGQPKGSYVIQSNGLFSRDYTNGYVMVNPTDATQSIALDDSSSSWVNAITGQQQGVSFVVVPAHSATIWQKSVQ